MGLRQGWVPNPYHPSLSHGALASASGSVHHAGQARILKALTRNSIICRTLGETNLREG